MGRKNRRKPLACPVDGCLKRGLRADLIRHASTVHPHITREIYAKALDQKTTVLRAMFPHIEPPRRWRPAAAFASIGLTAACAIGIIVYRWLAL